MKKDKFNKHKKTENLKYVSKVTKLHKAFLNHNKRSTKLSVFRKRLFHNLTQLIVLKVHYRKHKTVFILWLTLYMIKILRNMTNNLIQHSALVELVQGVI